MPIYVYRCQKCGRTHEALHSASAPALTICPHCGESSLKRIIAPIASTAKTTDNCTPSG